MNEKILNDENILKFVEKLIHSPNNLNKEEKKLLSNYEVAEKVIQQNALLIKDFSEEIRSDENLARLGFKQTTYIYKFLSDSLRDNEDILISVVRQNPRMVEYSSERLKGDREFLVKLNKANPGIMNFITLKEDLELWEMIVSDDDFNIKYYDYRLPESVKKSKSIALKVIEKTPDYYLKLPKSLLNEKELIETALKNNIRIYDYLPASEKLNIKWVKILLIDNIKDVKKVPNHVFLIKDNIDQMLEIFVDNKMGKIPSLNNFQSVNNMTNVVSNKVFLQRVLLNNEYKELFDELYPDFKMNNSITCEIECLYYEMKKRDINNMIVQSDKQAKKIKF